MKRQLFALAVLLVAALPAALPEGCRPPQELAAAIVKKPSAAVYDAAGAWFAEHNNLRCAVAAFESGVQLQPASAEAHYDLGVAYVRAQKLTVAADQFRLALKYDPTLLPARNSLATVLADTGHPDEAAAEFQRVLAADPGAVYALDHLAQTLDASGHYKAAIHYWQAALALEPGSTDMSLSLGVALYHDGQAAESIRTLTELTKSHPDLKQAHFTLGNILAQENRYREAADEYTQVGRLDASDQVARLALVKALVTVSAFQDALAPAEEYVKRSPADPEGHLMLGAVYRGLGEYTQAEPELERAVAGLRNNARAQYELGFVLARNNKLREAAEHLKQAAALKPTDTAAPFQLAGVLRKLGDVAGADRASEDFRKGKEREVQTTQLGARGNQANEYLQAGQPVKAAEVYRQMLAVDPGNAHTAYNLALALEAAHDTAGAREALEQAAHLDPKLAVARADMGRLDLAAGHLDSAQRWLESALADDPQLVPARGNLAVIRAMKGDNADAEKLLRQALLDDPGYTQGHLNLGLILAAEQHFAEAETELDKARALAPHDPRVLSASGKVKARLGKTVEAIALLRSVTNLTPQSAEAHLNLAIALADSYDLPRALDEAARASQLAPQSPAGYFNHGRILFDLGRNAEARADFEKACQLAPQMPEPHYFLAVIEKQAGIYARAIDLLQVVVKLQPRNSVAWYSLGQNLMHESRTAEAIAAWKQAITIDPDYTQALFNLSRALKPVDSAEAAQYLARYSAVQQKRRILDRAAALENDAAASLQAHEWIEAERQLKQAIEICGECAVKADLHKNLGLIYCHAGDIDTGEHELLIARSLKADDPDITKALQLIQQVRTEHSAAQARAIR